jgi:hypothetical protein
MEKLRQTEQVRDPNRLFGYIKSIQHKDGKVFVEFDLAEFFGRSATDANQIRKPTSSYLRTVGAPVIPFRRVIAMLAISTSAITTHPLGRSSSRTG